MSLTSRRIRDKLVAHLEISRPYTVAYAGLLGVAGAVVADPRRSSRRRALLGALVTMCGWLAGHYVGDYFDRDIDARSKPSRPIPSGRVSPTEAVVGMGVLIGVGNLAALALGLRNLVLAVGTTVLGVAYSKVFKSRALLGNLDRGLLGACAVLFGAAATHHRLSPVVWLVALLTVLHDGATNLIGAVRDIDGDRASNCQTVPVVYGVARSIEIASGMAAAAAALGTLALGRLQPSWLGTGLFVASLALAARVYGGLFRARARVQRPEALAAHKLLVVERLLLAGAFTAARAPCLAAGLLGVAIPISAVLQARMRDRHEQTS